MSLRVAVRGEVKREDARSRSESESEEGAWRFTPKRTLVRLSHVGQTRNRVIYPCPG